MLTEKTKIKRAAKIPWQTIDECVVILNPKESTVHELNSTASWVWMQIEEETTYGKLLELLCNEFNVDENEASKDLKDILYELHKTKLIEWR